MTEPKYTRFATASTDDLKALRDALMTDIAALEEGHDNGQIGQAEYLVAREHLFDRSGRLDAAESKWVNDKLDTISRRLRL